MTPETDTGAKNDDNITKNDKPSFVVPAPQEGETPVLLVDGKEVPADFDPNTNTLTPKQPIEPGKHKVTTAVKDSAGNVSDPSPELAIEIDKTAPNAGTLSFNNLIDSGTTGDNITNDNNFDLALAGQETGSNVVYQVSKNGGTTWETTTANQANLADGTYQYRAVVTDAAGNTATTNTITQTIDKTPPKVTITMGDITANGTTAVKDVDTGSSHTLTFTFSEKVTDFTTKDITGSFGKFTDLNTTDEGKTWTATYTAPANIGNGQDAIILRNGVVTDVAGNANADGAEADNTFTVKLVEPTPPATLSIADAMITEGTRSDTVTTDTTMKFTVTRSGNTAVTSSATWTVAHGTTTAEDFVGNLTGTVNFGAGETSKEISVTVKADNVVEKDETFTVTLSDPSTGTTITKETANGKITNDDKLTLQLESDTLGAGTVGTATDKITNDPTVNVLGLTEGQEWEYSIDGGEWQVGTGTSFELPDNTSIDGTGYTVKARLKEDTTQITESSTFTYDKVANAPVIAVVSANEVTGVAEAGALVTITDQLGKKLGSAIADATGSYTFNVDTPFVSGSVYKLNQLDKAGNQSISSEFNYVNLPRITKDWTDQSTGNIAITVGDSSGGIGNGNIYGIGTDVNTGDGNDSLYVKGQVFAAININMGGGDDYFRANYLSGTNGTEIDIDMGDGNDIFELTADIAGRSAYQSRILMGAGDDDARLSHYIASDWIDGGVGNDTLTFTNLFGKVADQDFSTIKGFETIDLTGTKDNILWNVNLATLEANGSETVLHIKGDKGDKVNLGASTSTAVNLNDSNGSTWSKIGEKTEDGVNYDVWHNSSSNNPLLDVYIQKDVTVI
ncbi:Ig-like domain-containing protein [Moraxella boevrei]